MEVVGSQCVTVVPGRAFYPASFDGAGGGVDCSAGRLRQGGVPVPNPKKQWGPVAGSLNCVFNHCRFEGMAWVCESR